MLRMLCVVLCLFAAGCVTARGGVSLDQSRVDRIHESVSTKDDVTAILGAPQDVRRHDDETFEYIYRQETVRNTYPTYCKVGIVFLYGLFIPNCYKNNFTTDVKTLTLKFDATGTLTKSYVDETQYVSENYGAAGGSSYSSQPSTYGSQPFQYSKSPDYYSQIKASSEATRRHYEDLNRRSTYRSYSGSSYGSFGY